MIDPEIIRQYLIMRGCSDDELVRADQRPKQCIKEMPRLISYQDAIKSYKVSADKLINLHLNGYISRVIAEKGRNKRVFFYIKELDEVLKKC